MTVLVFGTNTLRLLRIFVPNANLRSTMRQSMEKANSEALEYCGQ